MNMISFIVGFIIGGIFGMGIMCIISINKK